MSEQVWLRDPEGAYAQVDEDTVDGWKPRGYTVADEPAPTDWVWLRHNVHGGRAKFQASVAATWEAMGWEVSDPPEPVDLTKDRQLVDVDEPESPKRKRPARPATTRNQE